MLINQHRQETGIRNHYSAEEDGKEGVKLEIEIFMSTDSSPLYIITLTKGERKTSMVGIDTERKTGRLFIREENFPLVGRLWQRLIAQVPPDWAVEMRKSLLAHLER